MIMGSENAGAKKKETIWSKDFIILIIANMFVSMSSYLINAILSPYIKELGATDSKIGFIIGSFNTAALLSRPFSGPIVDAWDKKKLLVALAAADALCLFGYAAAANTTQLLIARLLQGVSYGTLASLALTMASSSLPPSLISSGVSIFALSHILPQAIGPGIGLWMAEHYGYRYCYILSGISLLVSAAIATRITPQNTPSRKPVFSLKTIFAAEALIPVIVICLMGLTSSSMNFLVLMVREREIEGLALYYTINAITLVAARPITGMLADRFGQTRVVPICLAVHCINLFCLATASSTLRLYICAVLNAAGYSSAYSLTQSLVMKIVPKERRGSAGSSCYIGMDLGLMLGASIAGMISQARGYGAMFAAMAVPAAAAAAIMVVWGCRQHFGDVKKN